MNSAQHLVLTLLLIFGTSAHAQTNEAPATPATTSQEDIPAEIPSAKTTLLKTAANKDYKKPLYFDQIDNGLILPALELDYDLADQGQMLKLGNVPLSSKNFYFALLPLGKTHAELPKVLSAKEANSYALVMSWPEQLLNHGTIEMISRTGTVLWSHDFNREDQVKWDQQLDNWRKQLVAKGIESKAVARSGIFGAHFALLDIATLKAPFWNQKESFRFCITQTEGRNSSKLCSQRYGTKSSGSQVMMGRVRNDGVSPRVLLQNEDAPLKKALPVPADLPTTFFAELATGESYEFVTLPNQLELMDIADSPRKPQSLRIVGYDTRPLQKSLILNPDQYTALTKLLGFESTIGDPRKFWVAEILKADPKIYLPGKGGGVFKQRFELSEIPRAQSRVYLSNQTPKGTYKDNVKLFGRKQPGAQISSDQTSIKVNAQDPSYFEWNFQAKDRGQINRSYLTVDMDGKTYRSYFEVYKGFPNELSGRFTGVQSSGDFIILGEVAYNHWFEDFFGWPNYWVSRQRWGLSAKYFQSFNNLRVDEAGTTAPLSVLTVDFKYRFTPGLWNRDETFGALASYQDVKFDDLDAPMLGVGAFWARSMPKVFDDLLNVVSIMRAPKWVDVEFIYYLNSMNSNVTLNSSMSLNFHGKVLWSERYFGEAGFGVKRYGFTDTALNQQAEMNSFYGTVGLGVNF